MGWVEAVRAPIKLCSVLLGTVPGASLPSTNDPGNADTINKVKNPPKYTLSDICDKQNNKYFAQICDYNSSVSTLSPEDKLAVDRVNVVTRSQTTVQDLKPLHLPEVEPLNITLQQFKNLQLSCETVDDLRLKQISGTLTTSRSGYTSKYI